MRYYTIMQNNLYSIIMNKRIKNSYELDNNALAFQNFITEAYYQSTPVINTNRRRNVPF